MFRRNIACFWYFIVAFPITLFYNSCRLCNRSVIRSCCTSYWSNRKYPRIAVISPGTCAATGSQLHLVRPLGFDISDRAVKRAGLDYWHLVNVQDYDGLEALFARAPGGRPPICGWPPPRQPQDYTRARFSPDCWLFFGKETAGLPEDFRRTHYDRCIRLPMRPEARSLNLSNSVAILTYEALRQNGFPGLAGTGEVAKYMNFTREERIP